MKRWEITYRFILRQAKRLSERQLMVLLAIVVGLLAGLGTILFESMLHWLKSGLVSWFRVESSSLLYLVYPAVGIILASLFVKYIVKDDISEGVTRVLYAMSKKGSRIKPHNCYSSIIGGATTIGFGGSVGPEAPIVLTGSAIGSNIGALMRLNYKNTTLLLACGAAAALAAIFKAPITGVIFVLEILMIDISVSYLIPLVISSVTATTLALFVKGFDPIIQVSVSEVFALKNIPMYVLLGVICGFVSYYFTFMNSRITRCFDGRPMYMKWIVGGLALGTLIFVFPPLYGEGYESFIDLMHGNTDALFNNSLFYGFRHIPWVVIIYLLAILVFKVIAMAATNASGGVGGTFAPSMFVGAFTGGSLAYVSNLLFGLNLPILSFTLVGMAGVMSGVMKAPLTSIFLIAELSNGYSLFIPLMVVSASSFLIGYYFEPQSIYTKKLAERGELLTHDKDQSVMVFLNLDSLMETDFHPISRDTTLGQVVELISTVRRNIFPVLDSEGILEGVVQLDDLRRDMFESDKYDTPMDSYMIPPPDVIYPDEHISRVLDKFEGSNVWMLPVIDSSRRYLGFISKSRILAAYRSQLLKIS